MITFKQFLSEEEKQDLVTYLRTYCKPACEEYVKASTVLWRGLRVRGHKTIDFGDINGFEIPVRDDRKPRDSSEKTHLAADKYFKKEFGIPLRSASLFAYSRKSGDLSDFGEPCVIFPHGDFRIYWSPSIQDFTVSTDKQAGKEHGDPEKWMDDFLNSADYQDGPIQDGLKQNLSYEKMIYCKKYLAIDFQTTDRALDFCEQAIK